MRTERNEFQQLVDHQLANVQWDHRMSNAVLRKLREEKKPVIPRASLRYALTFAVMVLAVGLLAISLLGRTPEPDMVIAAQPVSTTAAPSQKPDTRAEAVFQARQAVMDQYGLTLQTLGVFRDDCRLTDTGWVVRFYTNGQISSRLAGEYTVEKMSGFITASWTHDPVDSAVYSDGSLNRVAWGQQQLLYARSKEGAPEAFAITSELNAEDGVKIDYDYLEGHELWGDPLTDVEPAAEDIPVETAMDAVYTAIIRQFGLTDEQLSAAMGDPLSAENGSLRQSDFGVRVWVFYPTLTIDGVSYYTAVCINAQTGELERLEYTTLGNG